jgi:hypothetical protein
LRKGERGKTSEDLEGVRKEKKTRLRKGERGKTSEDLEGWLETKEKNPV